MAYGTYQTGTINQAGYDSMYGTPNEVQGFGIGNVPITTPPAYTFGGLTSPAPNTTVSYNPPVGPVGDVPLTTRPFPDLQGPKPTGNLSFTFGGGGGGGGGASVPSNVLTPRQFSPYESTYVPPTPATPDPYNWATRDPYTYGEGLSNAGAAYDIWGSAPGTNPYLMTVPSDYTPGLLGLQPVQLPDNVPSTNVGANINNPGSPPTTKPVKMNPIAGVPQAVYEKAMADTYRKVKTGEGQFGEGSYGYTGQDERATGGVNMSRAGIMAGTTPMKVTGPNYAPVTSFETKKQEARVSIQQAAVNRYGKKPGGTTKNYGVTGKRIVGGR